ncbi:hypothetical protein [Methanospirillum sp.]
MILLRLSTVINGVTIETEGEANDLDQIYESWETFLLSTYQVENGIRVTSFKELDIHRQNLTRPPTNEIIEVL